jgi:hypothetical protein
MMTAGPTLNGLALPNATKNTTQATTRSVTHSSRGHFRTASPNMSSTGAFSLPSTGIISQPTA